MSTGITTSITPLPVRRSQDFYISATINRHCENLSMTTDWTIANCTGGCSSWKPLPASIVKRSNELLVRARALEYGLYAFNLTVTIVETTPIRKSEITYVMVNPSGITANLIKLGTSMVTHGFQHDLILDPGQYSGDPDDENDKLNATEWNYKYSCRIYHQYDAIGKWADIDNHSDSNSCFYNSPNKEKSWRYGSNGSRSSITILRNTLAMNQTYQFRVIMDHIRNASQQATGYVFVRVVDSGPYMVIIGCVITTMCSPNLEFQYINPSTQVSLYSQPANESLTPNSIKWTVHQGFMNKSSDGENRTQFKEIANYPDNWFFGRETANFTASNALFLQNSNITFWHFEVVYTFNDVNSSSALDFEINQPPRPGDCSIDPSNGTTSTMFKISCWGWNDTDKIKDFSFYAWTADIGHRVMLGSTTGSTTGSVSSSTFELLLPAGSGDKSSVLVSVQVQDSRNCVTELNITTVSVVTNSNDINELISAIQAAATKNSAVSSNSSLKKLLDNSSPTVVAQLVTTISQTVNQITNNTITTAIATGMPAASIFISPLGGQKIEGSSESANESTIKEYMRLLNDHASTREFLMESVTNTNSSEWGHLLLQASSLARLTQATNQLTRKTCKLASAKCREIAIALNQRATKVSYEDIEMIANQIIPCATNVLSAINMPLQQRGKILELDSSRSGGISEDNNDDTNSELDGANLNSFDSKDEPSHERNIYYQKLAAKKVAMEVKTTLESIAATLKVHLNEGQHMTINTPAVFTAWEAAPRDSLLNKTIVPFENAQIRLPTTLNLNLNSSERISLRSMVQPLAIASASGSQVNNSLSTMISLSAFDFNGMEIQIQANYTHPIELIIPRDPNLTIPDMKLFNVTSIHIPNQQFYFHLIDIAQPNENLTVSLHFEMRPQNRNLNYLFIFKFNGPPQLNTAIKDIDDWYLFCSSNITDDGIHRYFIDNNRTAKHRSVTVGLRELNNTELCSNNTSAPPIFDQSFKFSSDYELRTFTSGCYYLDPNNNWQSEGLLVGPKTNHTQTQCFSTHLTTFVSGYSNVPCPVIKNPIFLSDDKINVEMNIDRSLYSYQHNSNLSVSYFTQSRLGTFNNEFSSLVPVCLHHHIDKLSVPDLAGYHSKKHGDDWKKFERDTPRVLFPYIW
ncbi:unnamed protein product [Rotaria socialis]|uniref:PKD/REJ-like domain-containing protein n=1 Tax=Rotaria socialis TaxID=392032 RepID=A0A820TBU4_9BILA|nr:unnamed protein product [Rotaria socialis]